MPQGGYPVNDPRQPTLVPNLDRPVALAGVVGLQSPAQFNSNFPRAYASVIATIGGTITNLDSIVFKLTNAALPGGSLSVTVPIITADSTDTIAHKAAKAINDALAPIFANQFDRPYADVTAANVITIYGPGPVWNSTVLSRTISGAATETVVFTPGGGAFSGGTGPVIPTQNFTWSNGSQTMAFFAGQPYQLDSQTIAAMVAQGMPIS